MIGIPASPCCVSPTLLPNRHYSAFFGISPSSGPLRLPVLSARRIRKSWQRNGVQCGGSSSSGWNTADSGSGENDSKTVLDAFFMGKAFAEALNERITSTFGEALIVIGQWKAEQHKQVQNFQEEVIERAKKAKEKAALEVMEKQGVLSKTLRTSSDTNSEVLPSTNGYKADPLEEMLKY